MRPPTGRPTSTRLKVAVAALLCAAATATGVASPLAPASGAGAGPSVVRMYATYYGWYTNTPPGCATAYSGCAHGTGTYADPITFASDKKELPVGTLLYYPTVEKYFVMGDECTECTADWGGKGPDGGPHLYHVDLWMGGKGGNEFDLINCEDALTQGTPGGAPLLTPFIRDPPPTLPVSTEPLFDAATGRCYGGATSSATYGRYRNEQSGRCLDDPSAVPGTPATTAPCNDAADEDLAFDGAFLVDGALCLQTAGAAFGSPVVFAGCDGNDRQQWEIGRHGTIAWVQYRRCVVDDGGTVELGRCAAKDADRWRYVAEKPA